MDNRPLKFVEFEEKINQLLMVSATPSVYEKEKSLNFRKFKFRQSYSKLKKFKKKKLRKILKKLILS